MGFKQFLIESTREETLHDFLEFAKKQLGLKTLPEIVCDDNIEIVKKLRALAYYQPPNKIFVYKGPRLSADILRSLAHEIVHYRQFLHGEKIDGSTGSPHENEANSVAGQLLRDYGKINAEIYDTLD